MNNILYTIIFENYNVTYFLMCHSVNYLTVTSTGMH